MEKSMDFRLIDTQRETTDAQGSDESELVAKVQCSVRTLVLNQGRKKIRVIGFEFRPITGTPEIRFRKRPIRKDYR